VCTSGGSSPTRSGGAGEMSMTWDTPVMVAGRWTAATVAVSVPRPPTHSELDMDTCTCRSGRRRGDGVGGGPSAVGGMVTMVSGRAVGGGSHPPCSTHPQACRLVEPPPATVGHGASRKSHPDSLTADSWSPLLNRTVDRSVSLAPPRPPSGTHLMCTTSCAAASQAWPSASRSRASRALSGTCFATARASNHPPAPAAATSCCVTLMEMICTTQSLFHTSSPFEYVLLVGAGYALLVGAGDAPSSRASPDGLSNVRGTLRSGPPAIFNFSIDFFLITSTRPVWDKNMIRGPVWTRGGM